MGEVKIDKNADQDQLCVNTIRTLAMDAVEIFGTVLRQLYPPLGDDAQARLFQSINHLTGNVAARCIGLDHRQGSLDWHVT